jgi:hypothetical protein
VDVDVVVVVDVVAVVVVDVDVDVVVIPVPVMVVGIVSDTDPCVCTPVVLVESVPLTPSNLSSDSTSHATTATTTKANPKRRMPAIIPTRCHAVHAPAKALPGGRIGYTAGHGPSVA